MASIKEQIGLLKSKVIYDFKPFNNKRLKTFYSQFIKSGDLCFDIGAHTGNRSNSWLKLGAKVIGAEPAPLLVKHLNQRFGSNTSFQLVQKGIGAKQGKLEFKISNLYPTVSTFSNDWKATVEKELNKKNVYDDSIIVDIITLEDLISKHGTPQFCKIDVEGAELDVLTGLKTPIKHLSFEFYSELISKASSCLELLDKLGSYEYNWSMGETLKLKESVWLSKDDVIQKLTNLSEKNSGDLYARLK